jgi:hypothetical protein
MPAVRRLPLVALLALGAPLLACQWGTRPGRLAVANTAAGSQVALRVTGERRDRVGELLAVDSGGLYLFTQRVTHVAWRRVDALDVAQQGAAYDLYRQSPPSAAQQARLALVSRFRVLSPDLLARVLRTIGQDTLDVVR